MDPRFDEFHIFIFQHQCVLGLTCCQEDKQKLSIQSHATLRLYVAASHKALKNGCSRKNCAYLDWIDGEKPSLFSGARGGGPNGSAGVTARGQMQTQIAFHPVGLACFEEKSFVAGRLIVIEDCFL